MYMQNFSLGRWLTFANLWFCGSSQEFFPRILGVWHPWRGKSETIRVSFLRENRIFYQFAKFSPSKVSAVRYCLVFMIQWLTGSAEKIDA